MSNNSDLNLRDTVTPKSDQMNADDLIGITKTITVTSVKRGDADQPVTIHYDGENGRPYKPCKSMRRVLIHAWGDNGNDWIGKSMTLYCDPEVKFGGVKVGGIRISHVSDINRTLDIALTATRGKRAQYQVKPLKIAAEKPTPSAQTVLESYPEDKFAADLPRMLASIESGKATVEAIIKHCNKTAPLTDDQIARLTPAASAPQDDTEVF